jgi:hypothetical protein
LPEGGTARGFLAKCPAAPRVISPDLGRRILEDPGATPTAEVNWKQTLPTASENAIEAGDGW